MNDVFQKALQKNLTKQQQSHMVDVLQTTQELFNRKLGHYKEVAELQ